MPHRELVIIGAGPAALTAAIYAARAGHAPVVYTGVEQPGGDLTTTTAVDNFPGFPAGIQGPELIEAMTEQATRFGTTFEYADVTAIDVAGQTLILSTGDEVTYDAVIFATGSEHRKLGLGGEEELTGRGVSYCATCDGMFFKDEQVVVVGGGDSAMEEALFLAKYATTVTVLVRGTTLKASKAMVDRVALVSNIEIRFDRTPMALYEEDGQVEGIVTRGSDGRDELHEATGVFIAIGSNPRTDLVAGQVPLTDAGTVSVLGRSSKADHPYFVTPGFFAAGDVIDPVYRQAIVAAGSGAVAGMDAAAYLDELGAHTN